MEETGAGFDTYLTTASHLKIFLGNTTGLRGCARGYRKIDDSFQYCSAFYISYTKHRHFTAYGRGNKIVACAVSLNPNGTSRASKRDMHPLGAYRFTF